MPRPARLAAPPSALLAAALALPLSAHAQPGAPRSAWVQYVGATRAEVRTIMDGDACPSARIDGAPAPLTLRASGDESFPGAVCSALLPAGARRVEVGGVRLASPKRDVRRVVIIGDTGCRLKGARAQACNDPVAWPFAAVARLAAARRPDLVIHVGDYWYRESPCPAASTTVPGTGAGAGCAGSPFGDRRPAWDADFFDPARPLLQAAPWVFTRGNHEDCVRGGPGWFRYLDAAPRPLACPAQAAPMKIRLNGLTLYVLDSADAEDRSAAPGAVQAFAAQLDALKPALSRPGRGWIVTHRPVWALVPAIRLGPLGTVEAAINATEQAAMRGRDLQGVQMIASGHIHHFATYDFGGGRPAQLVDGAGGDVGEAADSPAIRTTAAELDGVSARRFTFYRYGYLVLDRVGPAGGGDWAGGFHDTHDRLVANCRLHARSLTCRAA